MRALTRAELVRTFLDLAVPETTALLAVIAEVTGDEVPIFAAQRDGEDRVDGR
jgi:hypothetical protein